MAFLLWLWYDKVGMVVGGTEASTKTDELKVCGVRELQTGGPGPACNSWVAEPQPEPARHVYWEHWTYRETGFSSQPTGQQNTTSQRDMMWIILIRICSLRNRSSQESLFQIGPPVPLPQAQSQGWWCHIYCLSCHHSIKSDFCTMLLYLILWIILRRAIENHHLPSGWGQGCSRS